MDGWMAAAISDMEKAKYEDVVRKVNSGDNCAKTKLAWYMLSGRGDAAVVDAVGAVALLEERVKDRDSDAMWMLGLCYEYGIGLEQDVERAETLYSQSCDKKNATGNILRNSNEERGGGAMKIKCLQFNEKHFACYGEKKKQISYPYEQR